MKPAAFTRAVVDTFIWSVQARVAEQVLRSTSPAPAPEAVATPILPIPLSSSCLSVFTNAIMGLYDIKRESGNLLRQAMVAMDKQVEPKLVLREIWRRISCTYKTATGRPMKSRRCVLKSNYPMFLMHLLHEKKAQVTAGGAGIELAVDIVCTLGPMIADVTKLKKVKAETDTGDVRVLHTFRTGGFSLSEASCGQLRQFIIAACLLDPETVCNAFFSPS